MDDFRRLGHLMTVHFFRQTQVLGSGLQCLHGLILQLAIGGSHEQAVPVHPWRFVARVEHAG